MKPYLSIAALAFLLFCAAATAAQPEPRDERYGQALNDAVEKGDRAKVISLLNAGAKINAIWINDTPLATAVFYQHVEIVKLLLSRHAKVFPGDLAEAASATQGDKKKALTLVNLLLENGATVKTDGTQALRNAAIADVPDVLQVLLAKGANPNGRLEDGAPVLMDVVENDALDGIRMLLKAGADVKAVNNQRETVLMHAARATHLTDTNERVIIVKLLIDRGADVKAKDSAGNTALHFATSNVMTEAGGFIPRAAVVQLLLENGADPNAANTRGETPLMKILQTWHPPSDIIQVLIERGANLNLADEEGVTALMFAAEKDQTPIVQLLLDKGAAIDIRDKEGSTALVHAVQNSQIANVDLLLARHADLSVTPYQDEARLRKILQNFSLLNAIAYRRTAEVKSLLEAGADANARNQRNRPALVNAADTSDKVEIMKLLMDHGAELNAVNDFGNTALMVAAEANNDEGVSLLLDRHAEVNLRNNDQMTALMLAATRGNNRPTALLVTHGADVNARHPATGRTALMFASMSEFAQEPVVTKLLAYNAEINATDNEGNTALMFAARAAAFSVVNTLIRRGADVNAKNKAGETALQLARKSTAGGPYAAPAIVKMLEDAGAKQ